MEPIITFSAIAVAVVVAAAAIYFAVKAIIRKVKPTLSSCVSGKIVSVEEKTLKLKADNSLVHTFNIEGARNFKHGFELKKGADASVYFLGSKNKKGSVINVTLTNGEAHKADNAFDTVKLVHFSDFNIPSEYDAAYAAEKALKESTDIPEQTVWLGDEAAFPITLFTADKKLENLSANVCVKAENGETLSWDSESLFIEETQAYAGNCTFDKKTFKVKQNIPDVLFSEKCGCVNEKSLKNIWISVKIPYDAKDGKYVSRIEIKSAEEIVAEKEFVLNVLAIKMPNASEYDFDIELWQYPYRLAQYYGLEAFSEEHKELLKKHMLKYKEMGGSAITVSIVEEPWNKQTYGDFPSMIKWTLEKDGKFSFTFKDFDEWVELCSEIGLGKKIVCYSMIPWGNKITYFDTAKGQTASTAPIPGTPEYEKVWAQFLRALVEHTEEKGWFERIYIGIDERPKMERAFDVIENVKGKNGKCFKISAAMDHFSSKFFPVIDRISSVSVGSLAVKKAPEDYKTLIERRSKNSELKTTIYTCTGHFPNSFTYSLPFEGYHTMLYCASMGTTGYLRWALDAWVENPLADTTFKSFEAGDCFLVYPDKADSKEMQTKSSVRLEMLLKGLRDVNKLHFLCAQGTQWKEKADEILKKIKPTYAYGGAGIAREETLTALPKDMLDALNAINAMSKEYSQQVK